MAGLKDHTKKIIYIASDATPEGNGSEDAPLDSIKRGLEIAGPGDTLHLLAGEYSETVTIELSGTLELPLRIEGATGNTVTISAPWYLYDVTDIIISGLQFKDIESPAISLIGACQRNSISSSSFVNCGSSSKTACTLYMGGAGSYCNTIEKCTFEEGTPDLSSPSYGILVAEGDSQTPETLNRSIIIRESSFNGFTHAIILGTGDEEPPFEQFGHCIEFNVIKNTRADGIVLKCHDVTVRDNYISLCRGCAISIVRGREHILVSNRISDCHEGIHASASDINILENTFINTQNSEIVLEKGGSNEFESTTISANTFFRSSDQSNFSELIRIKTGGNIIIDNNIFSAPHAENLTSECSSLVTAHNITDNKNLLREGIDLNESIPFTDVKNGNYTTALAMGAANWSSEGENFPPIQTESFSEIEQPAAADDLPADPVAELINDVDKRELYARSFFMNDDVDENGEELEPLGNDEDENDIDSITDYSTWDL